MKLKINPNLRKRKFCGNREDCSQLSKSSRKFKENCKALLPDGLPGIDDTDIRNQWLNTKSVTFSNVYEAIEFLQNCG